MEELEKMDELELQDSFNEDELDILVEDGEIENVEEIENEEVADNGNENEQA